MKETIKRILNLDFRFRAGAKYIKVSMAACISVFLIMGMATGCTSTSGDDKATIAPVETQDTKKSQDVSKESTTSVNGELKVHFIDVGQADSILVQQGSSAMLIDAGNNADNQTVKSYLDRQGINELKYFIGTHKDEDHIGSADYIINSFKVGKVYFPKQTATTKTFEDFVRVVKGKGLKLTVPTVGESFKLGDATVTILAPNSSSYQDANDYSIVVKVSYGSTSFLLTGDAESVSESEMVSKGLDLRATVLKVGHHGSKSSTSQSFLNKVNPKYAVISVGKDNDYGHPKQEVMNRLKAKNIPVYRTDERGTIVATSNGSEVKFSTNPGSYNGAASSSSSSSSTGNSTTTKTQVVPAAVAPKSTVPTTPKTTTSANNNARIVYHTPSGKSYHYDKNCRTLSRSKTILQFTLDEAINSSYSDPCDVCTY
ncbi:competence protein ComEC [Clostridium pascui]|uniref:ComEC/Rec2 family competence protein n=1 Tax=Clostridium pascui TaxID=46609 RepID=UPI001FAF5EAE|nr:ComEC/Rec2 family competence protein [Clostridium pascui]MBM7871578.1 competence protein ComEC [Clostridium pascui]